MRIHQNAELGGAAVCLALIKRAECSAQEKSEGCCGGSTLLSDDRYSVEADELARISIKWLASVQWNVNTNIFLGVKCCSWSFINYFGVSWTMTKRGFVLNASMMDEWSWSLRFTLRLRNVYIFVVITLRSRCYYATLLRFTLRLRDVYDSRCVYATFLHLAIKT